MLTIKKYSNGKLYDTLNKEYISKEQLAEIVKNKKKFKVVLSTTGKDVTKSIIEQVAAATNEKNEKALKPENIKKWIGNQIDKRINKILGIMNLPTKDQINKLNAGLKKLAQKVEDLEKIHAQKIARLQKEQSKQATAAESAAMLDPDAVEIMSMNHNA